MIRRLWPESMAGRVAVVLVTALLVLCTVSAALYLHDRGQRTMGLFAKAMAEQVAAMADLIERTPQAERAAILAALGGPMMRVSISGMAPDLTSGAWKRPAELPGAVRRNLSLLDKRPVLIRLYRPWDEGEGHGRGHGGHGGHGGHRMVIAVGLEGGEWLHIRLQRLRPLWRWGPGPLGWLILTVILVLLTTVWAAHRMTRPLRQFAQAADRFGVDVRAPPMAEKGSCELRRGATAFNRMQDRLRLRAEFIEDGEQQDKAIADIDEMQAMLDETLSFARDDAREEAAVETDLSALLGTLCETMSDAGLPVTFEASPPLTLACRPVALRRAVRNILDNAVRYGGKSHITLSGEDGSAVIEITDQGPGIPEDMREKVFQPFFRLETSRSRETGGTGLGLSSARTILRRHGGDITLHDAQLGSLLAGGLLVRIRLPL